MTGGVRPDYRLIIYYSKKQNWDRKLQVSATVFYELIHMPPPPTYTVILLDLHRTISVLEEIYEAEEGRVD